MIIENILLALSGLLSNKTRTLLTMLGIIIGIASVIAILTVGDSITNSVTSTMQSMGVSNVTVGVKERSEEEEGEEDRWGNSRGETSTTIEEADRITDDMIEEFKLSAVDLVDVVSMSEVVGAAMIQSGKTITDLTVMGINDGYLKANDVTLLRGRSFLQQDMDASKNVAIISNYLVNEVFQGNKDLALGSEIEINQDGNYNSYTIVGIYEYVESNLGFSSRASKDAVTSFYIPVTTAKGITNNQGYSTFTVVSKADVSTDDMISQAEHFFTKYYRNNVDFEVKASSMESMVSSMLGMMSTITLAISFIAAIALLVGGIGVMNILLVSITERTREIGTRKALGATNGSIRLQFVVESIIICLIGGIIGIILGVILGTVASSLMGYPAQASLNSILLALGFSMFIGVCFGYYPANKAAKMNPIDALRYE